MGFRMRMFIPMFLAYVLAWIGIYQVCRMTDASSPTGVNNTTLQDVDELKAFPWRAVNPADGITPADKLLPDGIDYGGDSLPAPIAAGVHALSSAINASGQLRRDVAVLAIVAALLLSFGTACARATATEFCQQTRTGALASLKYSLQMFPRGLLSTLLAAILIGIPLSLLWFATWLSSLSGNGDTLAMYTWPILALLAVVAALTTIVVTIGWLLSLAAIGTDRCTGSDALSRGINYVLSHKLRTAWYLYAVIVLSKMAMMLTQSILMMANGLLEGRFPNLVPTARIETVDADNLSHIALQWWHSAIAVTPHIVEFSVWTSGITLIYVLLRQREDAVSLREIDGGRNGTA